MNTKKLLYPFSEMGAGLTAPLDSLRFLVRHKGMLAALLAVHLVVMVGYFFLVVRFALPQISVMMEGLLSAVDGETTRQMLQWTLRASAVIVSVLAYPLLGLPMANIVASPVFDWVAQGAFEDTAGIKVKPLSWRVMVRSFLFELVRLALMCALLSLMLISWIFVLFVPIIFVLSLWFYGWDTVDRTLAVLGYGMRRRLGYGIVHFLGCVSLGVWSYVPLFGFLLSFVMAGAGGVLVARLTPPAELERLSIKGTSA